MRYHTWALDGRGWRVVYFGFDHDRAQTVALQYQISEIVFVGMGKARVLCSHLTDATTPKEM